MAELGQRWPTQAQLMRDEFSKHRCPGQEWCRLLEAAKRTVGRSFLCLRFVVSRSVMPAEMSCVICGSIVCCRKCEGECMRVHVNVVACLKIFDYTARVFVEIMILLHEISDMLWTVFRRCERPKLVGPQRRKF